MSNVAELLRNAERAAVAKQWDQARDRFLQVLALEEHPSALLQLSYIESSAGHYRLAREYALRACKRTPTSPQAIVWLLSRLRAFNETGELRAFVRRSPQLAALDPPKLQLVSAQLSYLGDQEGAASFLDLALGKAPGVPQLLLARAQVNVFRGRFDEAERDLRLCLARAPGMADAWWSQANLRKQTPAKNHVDELRRRISAGALSARDSAYLHSALHKELDDLGDFHAAAAALEAACKARRSEQDYDDLENHALFEQIKALPCTHRGTVRSEFTPTFIVGMFRSGTTLLEQLIGGNPQVLNAGELQDMAACMRNATDHYCRGVIDPTIVARAGSADFDQVGRQYLDGVRWRLDGHSHITDKWPPNHINVGFICQALADAKIIHMVRDPVETCFSNLREMFSGAAPYSYDQHELARYYLRYRDLMRHWQERFPDRILEVDYGRLTAQPETVMREVAAFCGLDFLPQMLDPRAGNRSVATASAVQVRNQIVRLPQPKWKRYEAHLRPLIEGLGLS
ncbi:MAG: sulfotransferase [Pseudoxanthomonas sp.]